MRLSLLFQRLLCEHDKALKKRCKSFSTGELVFRCSGVSLESFFSLEISDIVNNSSLTTASTVFVCIKGEHFDGNDFIREAYKRGARVFVSENKALNIENSIVIITNNARKTMAELCKSLYYFDGKGMKIVGVTGTKGKTTVTELLSSCLRKLGILSFSVGTLGCSLPLSEGVNTTPDPTLLYPLLKKAFESGIRVAVIEVSSQALKDFRVWGLKFDFVAFTSLGYDHIGGCEHQNFSDYLAAKRSLFTSYGARVAVVNYDDPYSAFISSGVERVIRCGRTLNSDFLVSSVRSDFSGMDYVISNIAAHSLMPGDYNAINIAIAAALAMEISGESLSDILGLMSDISLPGRFECYRLGSRYAVIDYAHNEKSLCELIALVRSISNGRIILVFGSVGGRSYNRRYELAKAAEKFADFSVITSDNPGYEDPLLISSKIHSYFQDKSKACVIVDREEAIKYAIQISESKDTVLLLGKGHEEFMLIKGKRVPFSERTILKQLSYEVEN